MHSTSAHTTGKSRKDPCKTVQAQGASGSFPTRKNNGHTESDAGPADPRPLSGLSLAASTYVFAVVMMGTTLPTPLYPDYEQQFGFESFTTTLLYAIYAGGVIAALVLFGQASRRWGRRPVLAVGVALSLISAVLFLFAGSLWILYLGRIVSGLSAGIFTATGTVAVTENAPASRKALASALATGANIGGLGLGVLVAGAVADATHDPLHAPFLVHAGLVVIAGFFLLAVRESVVPDKDAKILRLPRVPKPAQSIFKAASIGAIAGFAACGIYTSVAPGFMAEILGTNTPTITGLVVFVLFGSSAAGQIVFRSLTDRTLIMLGTLALSIGMIALIVALAVASLPVLVVSSIVAGIGQGLLFMTGMRAILGQTPTHQRTRASTSYFIVAYLSISVPSIAAGMGSVWISLTSIGIISGVVIGVLTLLGLANLKKFEQLKA